MQCLVFALIFWGLVLIKRFSRTFHMAARAEAIPVVWASRSFLRALPISHHRISGRMLVLTFLGLLLLSVDCFFWCGILGFLLWGEGHMVRHLRFARRHNGSHAAFRQSRVICLPLCVESDPTCDHNTSSYKTRLQGTRNVSLAGYSSVGDTTSVILDLSTTLVVSCTST